jgi:Kdo2-lipid IVA lauroyltransferase/acyltransferase
MRSYSLVSPRYWPTWVGIALLRTLEPLPLRMHLALGAAIGWFARVMPLKFRRIAARNLELCFPDLEPAQRRRILRGHFRSLGVALFETAITWWSPDARIRRITHVEGTENLDRALAAGKGAILLSAHFTTLEIGARAICARMPVNIMYRPSRNPVLERFLQRSRSLRARRAIPRDDIRTLVSALGANEPVWYAPDQSYRKKGAQMVPFFGIPAASNTFTSRLAQMTGAAVLTFSHERLPNAQGYRVAINPPLEGFPSGDAALDTEHFHRFIEGEVRRNPAQFWWIHRRFKGLSPDYPDYYGMSSPPAPTRS